MTNKLPPTKIAKIKPTVMSLDEFRSYLKGIMFVGGKNWVPNAQQWSAIVQIIDQLDIKPVAPIVKQYPSVAQPVWNSPPPIEYPQHVNTSTLSQSTGEDTFPSFV
jgi:hypothetical protein